MVAPDDRSVFITRTAIAVILICLILAGSWFYGPSIIASWNEMKFADAVALMKNKEVTDVIENGGLLQITTKNGKVYMARYTPGKDIETLLQLSRETGFTFRGGGPASDTQGWLYVIKYFPRSTFVFLAVWCTGDFLSGSMAFTSEINNYANFKAPPSTTRYHARRTDCDARSQV
jgi:hypothetical protein